MPFVAMNPSAVISLEKVPDLMHMSSVQQAPAVFPHLNWSEVKDRYVPLRAHDIHLLLTFNIHFLSLLFPDTVLKHICYLQFFLTGTFQG